MKPFFAVVGDIVVFSFDYLYGLSVLGFKKGKAAYIVTPHVTRLVGFCFFISFSLNATTIVGIWTEKQITIAADSKQTIGGVTRSYQTACKLYTIRDLIVAFAGLVRTEESDVIAAIQNSREFTDSKTGKKLPEAGPFFAAQAALEKVLSSRSIVYDPTVNASMIIAGRIDGKLVMVRVRIIPVPPTPQEPGFQPSHFAVSLVTYPEMRGYGGSDPGRGFEIIGIRDSISRFQLILPQGWKAGSDVEVAGRLVAIEASDSNASHFVGGPISVITINKNGAHWVDRGVCDWEPNN